MQNVSVKETKKETPEMIAVDQNTVGGNDDKFNNIFMQEGNKNSPVQELKTCLSFAQF